MHLFIRSVHMSGPGPQVLGYASGMREYVDSKLDSDVALWAVDFGRPVGTLSYSTTVDGLAGYTEMVESFTSDDAYWAKAAEGIELTDGAENHLLEAIYGEFGGAAPVGAVATGTTAVTQAGFTLAVEWGVAAAQMVEQITEQPVIFGTDVAGTFGEFGWITVSADAAAADAANAKLRASAEYVEMVSSGRDIFVAGASHRTVSTRLA